MNGLTLLDVFVPPEGMVGHSAILVAMTGAEDFLEEAAQRFTGLRPRQRLEFGGIYMYLMLDGHISQQRQSVLPPGRIPGLHEFQPRPVGQDSLLHAKIVLLGFADSRTGNPVHLRLAVLTANFTYTSARHQLELVWVLDLPLRGTAAAEDRADMIAAGKFIEALLARRFYRDEQSLPAEDRKLTARLDTLLNTISRLPPARRRSRFIHSLDETLYEQIRVRFQAAVSRRNILLCGSGFYERPTSDAEKPLVFDKLEHLGVFTGDVCRIALVEPDEAGAVAAWTTAGDTDGWTISRPCDAGDHARRLHAKFVYAGYLRNGHFSNGCLYLGSGNLSRRGILSHGAMRGGNVETGVVFAVDERLDPEQIKSLLFWSNNEDDAGVDGYAPGQVGDAPECQEILAASPILSAVIVPTPERHLHLLWREDIPVGFRAEISWTGRARFSVNPDENISLHNNEIPAVLEIYDEAGRMWSAPVVDASGRIGWKPQRFNTYADALSALLDFPINAAEVTQEEDERDDDDDSDTGRGSSDGAAEETIQQEKNYALHAAAELVEQVADLQAALPQARLDDWIDHLDRAFQASFPEPIIAAWRTYRIDIFAHLQKPELRPPCLNPQQEDRYCQMLNRAAHTWALQDGR